MIAGHFGFAAIVKSREPKVPLWSLMLATVWLDIVFIPLFVMKIETAKPVPGLPGGYGENIIYADYTHSLLGALALSAVFALIFGPLWGKRCAIVLGLVSFSHWMLDLIVHRHDMPLLPGAWLLDANIIYFTGGDPRTFTRRSAICHSSRRSSSNARPV